MRTELRVGGVDVVGAVAPFEDVEGELVGEDAYGGSPSPLRKPANAQADANVDLEAGPEEDTPKPAEIDIPVVHDEPAAMEDCEMMASSSTQLPDQPWFETQAECAICLSDFEKGDRVRVLPCHHIFHLEEVDEWLIQRKKLVSTSDLYCMRPIADPALVPHLQSGRYPAPPRATQAMRRVWRALARPLRCFTAYLYLTPLCLRRLAPVRAHPAPAVAAGALTTYSRLMLSKFNS